MRILRLILPLLTAALLLNGCRSAMVLKSQKEQQKQESSRLIHSLLEYPEQQELTASLSISLNGSKVNGQLRMRRGRSIQISASVLGLMEVARVEFLPDMVVVMDRVHEQYSVCHYADIPYRNELGLDFEVIQALLWNRIFSPGSSDMTDAAARLQVQDAEGKETISIKDMECGYLFLTDGRSRLNAVSKSGADYTFRMDYTDFTALSGKWNYPIGLKSEIKVPDSTLDIAVKLSSVQTDRKNWPDRTQVSRRMKQVSLDELLDNAGL